MNAVLIGYRGTGKSSIAELVAMATDRTVFSMDARVSEITGCSIPEFVDQHGWEAFADLESQIATEAAQLTNAVIDTGGGVVRRPGNMAILKETGKLFWLTAHVDTIKDRIKEEAETRPALTEGGCPVDEVEEVLYARLPVYAEYADHAIETDGRTLSEIANEIIEILCS